MKLYNVKMWFMGDSEVDNRLIFAENEEAAEDKAMGLDKEGYDCFEAEEVTEVDGYRVVIEKIG